MAGAAELVLPPAVGALVGWWTNYVALWLLFRPRRPWRLGPWTVQGLLPRRRAELAEAVAEVVARELVQQADLRARAAGPELRERVVRAAVRVATAVTERWLPGFLPEGLRTLVLQRVTAAARAEAGRAAERLLPQVIDDLLAGVDVRAMVRERLDALDLAELEALVRQVAGRELAYIVRAGAVLGFLVGLVQAAVMAALP